AGHVAGRDVRAGAGGGVRAGGVAGGARRCALPPAQHAGRPAAGPLQLRQHPALVFASMNLGVVVLGALTGVLLFRERLSRINLAGLGLALLAIALLAWA